MRTKISLGILMLLSALALVTPASAVTVNGVDYVLLAKRGILMEPSSDCDPLPAIPPSTCMIINGNVGVSDDAVGNQLKIAARNIINGSAIAFSIVFGTNSQVLDCKFKQSSGVAPAIVCTTITGPPVLPIVAAWPPGPLGAVVLTCNTSTAPSITVTVSGTLPKGCYKSVRVNAGVELTLLAGAPNDYQFNTLRLLNGATLKGNGQIVKVAGQTISEANVKFDNVSIYTPATGGEMISIGGDNRMSDVVLYAPLASIHLRGGMQATNGFEAVADFITVQPIVIGGGTTPECGCFEDVSHVANSGTVVLQNGQNLTNANAFFLATAAQGCNVAGAILVLPTPGPGCATNDTCTLDVAGKPAGTYRVIGQWNTGTYCNNTLITLP